MTAMTLRAISDRARAAVALLVLLAAPAGGAAAATYDIAVPAQNSAPHKFLTIDGQSAGICPDLLRAIERIDPSLHFSGYTSTLSLPLIDLSLTSGRAGAACALLDTPARNVAAVRLRTPLYVVRQKAAVRAADPIEVANLDQLGAASGDQPVIVTRGSPYASTLREAGLKVDDTATDREVNLRKLAFGRARFMYDGEFALTKGIAAAGLAGQLRVLPAVLGEQASYFWVSRKQPEIVAQKIESALGRLAADGELARIVARYHVD